MLMSGHGAALRQITPSVSDDDCKVCRGGAALMKARRPTLYPDVPVHLERHFFTCVCVCVFRGATRRLQVGGWLAAALTYQGGAS